jgi:hypothetical protein
MIKKLVVLFMVCASMVSAQKIGSETTKKILLFKSNGRTERYVTVATAVAATDTPATIVICFCSRDCLCGFQAPALRKADAMDTHPAC